MRVFVYNLFINNITDAGKQYSKADSERLKMLHVAVDFSFFHYCSD